VQAGRTFIETSKSRAGPCVQHSEMIDRETITIQVMREGQAKHAGNSEFSRTKSDSNKTTRTERGAQARREVEQIPLEPR